MEESYLNAQSEGEDRGGRDDGRGVALVSMSSRTSLVENGTSFDQDRDKERQVGSQNSYSSAHTHSMDQPMKQVNQNEFTWKQHLKSGISLLSTKTVALSLIQGAPGCIPWGIINVFLNDYLSEDRGFSIQIATTVLMFFSIGYALGLVVGGVGGKYLYKIDIRLPALLAGGTAILGCIPLWYLLNSVDSDTPFFIVAFSAILTGIGSAPTGPIIKATLTNVTLPRARGQAFALFNLFDDFGKGLGPYFVSLLIVSFGGRLPAFNVGVLGWLLCGVANIAIYFTVAHDELVVQNTLSRQLSMEA